MVPFIPCAGPASAAQMRPAIGVTHKKRWSSRDVLGAGSFFESASARKTAQPFELSARGKPAIGTPITWRSYPCPFDKRGCADHLAGVGWRVPLTLYGREGTGVRRRAGVSLRAATRARKAQPSYSRRLRRPVPVALRQAGTGKGTVRLTVVDVTQVVRKPARHAILRT